MVFQFTGLSGAGKTTLANLAKIELTKLGFSVVIIDGDEIRQNVSKDLGFSKSDRIQNIVRIANFSKSITADIVLISIINPYKESRDYLAKNLNAKLIWIDCCIEELKIRDTKGLYCRALLPDDHPKKLFHLTGVNSLFETPCNVDYYISTEKIDVNVTVTKIVDYFLENLLKA